MMVVFLWVAVQPASAVTNRTNKSWSKIKDIFK
jgi:hypothetical protein